MEVIYYEIDNSNDAEKVVIDTTKLRNDAGKD